MTKARLNDQLKMIEFKVKIHKITLDIAAAEIRSSRCNLQQSTYKQELISTTKWRKRALNLRGLLVLTVVECCYALFTI